ncbi:hypothetical protein [Nocardioides dilutus]
MHSLVVGDDGVVYGTGSSDYGQLTGTGNRATLTALTGLPAGVRGVTAAASWYHSLVVGDDGVVYGTGRNNYGELTGTGNRTTLTALTGLSADTTAPRTTITKHPKKKTRSHTAKFVFKSNEPGSTFKCKLDKKKWKKCKSPTKYQNLKVGKHKFQVRAIDAAGNLDPTPAVWKWKIKPRT